MNTEQVLKAAVVAGVIAVAAAPTNGLKAKDVSAAALEINERVQPILEHVTNNEPWYQSRVTWGAIISTITPLAAMVGVQLDWLDPGIAAQVLTAVAAAVGGLLTLYGRWKARKPIGA